MSLFKQFQSRQIARKANNFIKGLKNKSEKEVEQAYLDNNASAKETESKMEETLANYKNVWDNVI